MDKKDLTISNDDLADIFGTGGSAAPVIKPEPAKKASAPPAQAPAKKEEPPEKTAFAEASAVKGPEPARKEPPWKTASAEASAFDKSSDFAKASSDKPADKSAGKDAGPEPKKSKLILDRAEEAYKAQEMLAAKAEMKKKDEHSVDDLIKRAQEIEKQMASEPDKSLVFADFIDEKTVAEIIHAFNDLKAAFSKELAGRIDQRSVDNMMLRTLERTAVGFVLLKNTSWDPEGQLKMDGSIDTERFVKNMSAYREQIQEIDKEIEESLKALMFMRLVAVKKGLGADKYAEIKNGLIRRSTVVEGGYKKAISKFIKKNIMENSMRKTDEEK